jgi:hypothetical protein
MHRSETLRLRNILPALFSAAALPGVAALTRRDTIAGWDEMQGYGDGYDTVGLSWGDVGHAANIAVNPVAQYHALQRAFGHGGGGPAPQLQQQRRLPMSPQLPPNSVQAMQSGPRRLLSYMGLGTLSWASTDTVTEKLMQAEPQAAFRGRRLVIDVVRSSGAAGVATSITKPLTVSGMPQTPAPDQAAPTSMFSAATTYSMLDLQIATSATQISMGISVSAIPASGETVVVTAGLYGEWLR